MALRLLVQPRGASVGARLIAELESARWREFRMAVAFAKMSGAECLDAPLRRFVGDGGQAVISVGIDHAGTSFEALSQLLGALTAPSELYIAKHIGQPPSTFHPKVFVFLTRDGDGVPSDALVIIGSTNLTEGGLFTNYEISQAWSPDLSERHEAELLSEILAALESWTDVAGGLATQVDVNVLVEFHARGWIPSEEEIAEMKQAEVVPPRGGRQSRARRLPGTLKKQQGIEKPKYSRARGAPAVVLAARGAPATRTRTRRMVSREEHHAFYIDITAPTDKTEIYLSKTALSEDPAFFGHPFTGLTTPKKATSVPQPERDPRPEVDIRLMDEHGSPVSEYRGHRLKMWQYVNGPSANQDVRITIPAELLRSLPEGCILEMRRQDAGSSTEYRLDFLTPGSRAWDAAREAASKPLPGRKRKYGWV